MAYRTSYSPRDIVEHQLFGIIELIEVFPNGRQWKVKDDTGNIFSVLEKYFLCRVVLGGFSDGI